MTNSLTYLKRERFIADRILDNIDYAAVKEIPAIKLEIFEGKPFKYLTSEELLELVIAISTKFESLGLINGFKVEGNKEIVRNARIVFDLKGKKTKIEQYRDQLNNEVGKIELQDKVKKGNYCRLDPDTKTFYFTLPNGAVQHFALYTERSTSENMFLLFKVLYEHWLEFNSETLTKQIFISKLQKLGWDDVDGYKIKRYINNLRDYKIKPAKLEHYINIYADRKENGYKILINYL